VTATPLWSDNPSDLDLLGFRDVTAPIAEAVQRENLDPVTVSIEGDWGSGKSSILAILADQLGQQDAVVVVSTTPWEYDPTTDPRATLIGEVLTAIRHEAEARMGGWEHLSDTLKSTFTSLARRVKFSKVIKLAANTALTMGLPRVDDIIDLFGEDKQSVEEPTLQGFRSEFSALMKEIPEIARVVVLVDDLDRCLPGTVVATLEAIKLFLSVPKMAFVLAADRRTVSLAIAAQYEPSPQAAEMGRQYLEKIVQIPVRVPTLGRADTEAYLALLMVERHLEADGELSLAAFAATCAANRAAGENDIVKDLRGAALPEEAKEDLTLAAMLAPVLYERLAGNPRRLKRFLNEYWIRSTIAGLRGIRDLKPAAVAKLMVLEQLDDAAFAILLTWVREGTLKINLRRLEQDGEVAGSASEPVQAALMRWSKLDPKLGDVDLDPYLRLAASLRSQVSPDSGLPPEVGKIAELFLGSRSEQNDAAQRLPELSPDHLAGLARYLVDHLKREPDQEELIGDAIIELAKFETAVPVLAVGLSELNASAIQGPLVVKLAPQGEPLEGFVKVIKTWLDSGRLEPGVAALAERHRGRGPV
jgi:hypothetical protein